ncbi:right-handed parallel beta-helix repeat-containing protein [Eleftheria terrae]|uniref:right-handed parallel beta-helix repeat-containing protein n=1 Tax=Eleftheria terrae TaxID=1597781 RepID=UPI00263AC923|nr:right-handed parallel beta-helix repeat-containing protein [Eleftheria terrae]WKB53903.1 right-handed parallel beta-helix repeat-containing protein [Eleftheria terrae]
MSLAQRRKWVFSAWLCVTAALAACGGGGSDNGSAGNDGSGMPNQVVPPAPEPAASGPGSPAPTPDPGAPTPPAPTPKPPATPKPPPPPPPPAPTPKPPAPTPPAPTPPAPTPPAPTPKPPAPAPAPSNAPPELSLTACQPSGKGKDYQVGPYAGQLADLDQVPWEKLAAGDTVRVFYRPAPYHGKAIIAAQGRADAPVRLCGVPGPQGERPVLEGKDAVARRGLAYGHELHESRSVIVLNRFQTEAWEAYPKFVQIDGLRIRGAHPKNQFTDTHGQRRNYVEFGACVWVERGHNVVIANNEIDDCTHAIFTNSKEDGDFAVTRNLRIAGNYIHDNGVAGVELVHNTYIQSVGVVYEFNRYGPLRSGAYGNAIKDRSAGVVIRYNRIEGGAHSLDLVEAEDYFKAVKDDPTYRHTYVYGNQITKDGTQGTTIHYGGDHGGNEASYRKGTLYFFNNTVHIGGNGYAVIFQLSTIDEKAEVWNNVFMFAPTVDHPRMREKQDNEGAYADPSKAGGIVNLYRNWIDARWSDSGPWHTVGGKLNGASNLITGTTAPVDLKTFVPLANSPVLNAAQATPTAGASAFPVGFQLDTAFLPKARTATGGALDLGAVER